MGIRAKEGERKIISGNVKSKNIFFLNLDGLRFFCFLSVFLYHSFYTEVDSIKNSTVYLFIKNDLFNNGNIGVNFFFVLSGFLITYLLIEEKNLYGKIDIPKFWIRRILRIWPLYFFCVFFGFIVFPIIKNYFGQSSTETANPIYFFTFTNNFDFIYHGLPDSSILGVLWSIAIEEQFYFVWPILLAIIPTKHYLKLFFLIILASWIFRIFSNDPRMNEYHTLSCMSDLAIGALGAYLCGIDKFLSFISNLKKGYILAIYILFFVVFFFREQLLYSNYYFSIFDRVFIAAIILMIILEQNFSKNSFFKMSNFKSISKLGTISYGLYCLHFIGILIAIQVSKTLHINDNLWIVIILETITAFIISVIISKLSFKYFESPFLKLKDKFAYITK